MNTIVKQWTGVALASMLALPMYGCREEGREQEREKQNQEQETKTDEKGLEIEIDAGGTKVKIKGGKTPGEKGVDVDVEHGSRHDSDRGDK